VGGEPVDRADRLALALDPQQWALVTLALSNGLALERLVDPSAVPDNLMGTVQTALAARP